MEYKGLLNKGCKCNNNYNNKNDNNDNTKQKYRAGHGGSLARTEFQSQTTKLNLDTRRDVCPTAGEKGVPLV
jgi:hypothetical protein